MPLIRKLLWYCCPTERPNVFAVSVEVLLKDNVPQDTCRYLFAYELHYPKESDSIRHCPTCGSPVPTPEAMATLEGLTL